MVTDLVQATDLANAAVQELKAAAVEADTTLNARLEEAEKFGIEFANHISCRPAADGQDRQDHRGGAARPDGRRRDVGRDQQGAVGAAAARDAAAHPGQRGVKTIRLLPVVIFAALALLLFKGIGLLTTGGYV